MLFRLIILAFFIISTNVHVYASNTNTEKKIVRTNTKNLKNKHYTHSKSNPTEQDKLKDIIFLVSNKRIFEAEKLAKKCSDKRTAQDILYLMKIYYDTKNLNLGEIARFFSKNPWIPFLPFSKNVENSITQDSDINDIYNTFKKNEPSTSRGKLYLLNALIELRHVSGNNNGIQSSLRQFWKNTELDINEDNYFLQKYKNVITIDDIIKKIEFLTWEDSYVNAQELISFVPSEQRSLPKLRLEIARAKLKHRRNTNHLPKELVNDDLFQYTLIKNLLYEDKYLEAIKKLELLRPKTQYTKWWKLKNIAIRDALKIKRYDSAYRLAVDHNLDYGADFAEAEWLAGWISLRFINNIQKAVKHFTALYSNTKLANSKSKAAYWLARAYEKSGDKQKAENWYNIGGEYKGTFYGQLCHSHFENLNTQYFTTIEASLKSDSSKYDKTNLAKLTNLIILLNKANVKILSRALIHQISQDIDNADILNDLAKTFISYEQHDMAVELSRTSSNYGHPLFQDGFPKHVQISKGKLPESLYLSIIRQESSFNSNAKSPAGASGLMQIMPTTAAKISKDLGMKRNAYLKSPTLNVKHGVKYFDQLFNKYKNIPLAIAAYNAGPGNVNKWITRYGDPRINCNLYCTLDWIESIPFAETRNYVRKVLENYIIYSSMIESKKYNSKTLLTSIVAD